MTRRYVLQDLVPTSRWATRTFTRMAVKTSQDVRNHRENIYSNLSQENSKVRIHLSSFQGILIWTALTMAYK